MNAPTLASPGFALADPGDQAPRYTVLQGQVHSARRGLADRSGLDSGQLGVHVAFAHLPVTRAPTLGPHVQDVLKLGTEPKVTRSYAQSVVSGWAVMENKHTIRNRRAVDEFPGNSVRLIDASLDVDSAVSTGAYRAYPEQALAISAGTRPEARSYGGGILRVHPDPPNHGAGGRAGDTAPSTHYMVNP